MLDQEMITVTRFLEGCWGNGDCDLIWRGEFECGGREGEGEGVSSSWYLSFVWQKQEGEFDRPNIKQWNVYNV
jgi:hypothetical protein